MINVVFLLLVFFLMASRIAPAPPFRLVLPAAGGAAGAGAAAVEGGAGRATLYLAPDGRAGAAAAEGEGAWAALAALPPGTRIEVQADAGVEAAGVARALRRLAALGHTRVAIAVRPR